MSKYVELAQSVIVSSVTDFNYMGDVVAFITITLVLSMIYSLVNTIVIEPFLKRHTESHALAAFVLFIAFITGVMHVISIYTSMRTASCVLELKSDKGVEYTRSYKVDFKLHDDPNTVCPPAGSKSLVILTPRGLEETTVAVNP